MGLWWHMPLVYLGSGGRWIRGLTQWTSVYCVQSCVSQHTLLFTDLFLLCDSDKNSNLGDVLFLLNHQMRWQGIQRV